MARRRRDPLLDLKLSDAVTFFSVLRHHSLSAAARELGVTTSQVSKAIARLERQLDINLLHRGAQGVEPTLDAPRVGLLLEEAMAKLRQARQTEGNRPALLTMAGPSYVVGGLGGMVARTLKQVRSRVLQLAPPAIRASATTGTFDVAFISGEPFALESWTTLRVGEMERTLFAPPAVARRLGPGPVDVERVKQETFVCPVNLLDGRFVPLDDGCPLTLAERKVGHEAQTLSIGLEMAAASEQVVYGPVVAALNHIREGSLVPIAVKGWSTVEPLHMMVHVDRVTGQVRDILLETARNFIAGQRLDARQVAVGAAEVAAPQASPVSSRRSESAS